MEYAIVFCCDYVGARTLEHLIATGDPVDLVVVTRDTPEIAEMTAAAGIECLQLRDAGTLERVKSRRFRWLLNLWGTAVLDAEVLSTAEHRLNIHPGLLPGTRGTDCASWAIRLGNPAGVSLLDMTAELDAGDIYASKEIDVAFPTTGLDLAERLKRECIELFKLEWPGIRDGRVTPVPQEGEPRIFRRADTLKDRCRNLDADTSTREVFDWLLAHDFAPHSMPQVKRGGRSYTVAIRLEEERGAEPD